MEILQGIQRKHEWTPPLEEKGFDLFCMESRGIVEY